MNKLLEVFILFTLFMCIVSMTVCCVPHSSYCTLQYKDFHYQQRVKVTSGFYRGNHGVIISRHDKYVPEGCNTPAFEVNLFTSDEKDDIKLIDQNMLESDE